MIVDTLEQTLNGGYGGLYGEVVTEDTYRLKQVRFQPDIVFDIGANVGIFTRYARALFPKAKIVAVEPNPENCAHFRKFTDRNNIWLMEYALGKGELFHGTTARNGSGETYLSAGLGYPLEDMIEAVNRRDLGLESSTVPAMTLEEIVASRWRKGEKMLLKIDCEGAENTIWGDRKSMDILRQADYLAMEVHDYALNGTEHKKVVEATFKALASLEKTHQCERDGVHFWATKK